MHGYNTQQKFKELIHFLLQTTGALLASLFFIPLSLGITKKSNRILVIGRDNGLFLDNSKHFYLYLCQDARPKPDVLFITSDTVTYSLLNHAALPVAQFPSFTALVYLLTANIIVIDSAEWITDGKFQLTFASRKIQLWHGAPLKEIELPLFDKRLANLPLPLRILLKFQKTIIGRYARNDLVITTSNFFTQNAFHRAFSSRDFFDAGYPRNDSLYQTSTDLFRHTWLNSDLKCIKNIIYNKNLNRKILLYMPTFRKAKECPFHSRVLNFEQLDDFLTQNNYILVLKVHPVLADIFRPAQFKNIFCYNSLSDIYPALTFTDCLITDYSSIYFDYLLLNKPIIFFTYDYESYIADDRRLLFDFKEFAPGPICKNQIELENCILKTDVDEYENSRAKLRKLTFTYEDGNSSLRIWNYLYNHYINDNTNAERFS